MGLFRREERIHFKRDETGEVVETTRSGNVGRTPVSDALLKQEKKKKKKPWFNPPPPRKQRRNRSLPMSNPFDNMFDMDMGPFKKKGSSSKKYYISGGKAYPIVKSKKKKKPKSRSRDPFDFDMMDNWGLF